MNDYKGQTPGPWKFSTLPFGATFRFTGEGSEPDLYIKTGPDTYADLRGKYRIGKAINAKVSPAASSESPIPALLARVEQLEAALRDIASCGNARVREYCATCHDTACAALAEGGEK